MRTSPYSKTTSLTPIPLITPPRKDKEKNANQTNHQVRGKHFWIEVSVEVGGEVRVQLKHLVAGCSKPAPREASATVVEHARLSRIMTVQFNAYSPADAMREAAARPDW